jgi:hypothetical protein
MHIHVFDCSNTVNPCRVYTVPGPLLNVGREYHLSGIQYARQLDPSDLSEYLCIYDQVVGRKSVSEFGKATTIYGIRDPIIPSSPVLILSHAPDYLMKLLTFCRPGYVCCLTCCVMCCP